MRQGNEEDRSRTKLENIELDLDAYKILLLFQGHLKPLSLHFDTPSRRFYFSLITLVVIEMKNLGKPGFINVRKHEHTLTLLDRALAGKYASNTVEGMWDKIRKAWHYRLPELETASLFKILERNIIPPYEKGGKHRYDCSDEECDTWANLFDSDKKNKWRFGFAVESASLGLDEVRLTLGDLRDDLAWQRFLKSLQPADQPAEKGSTEWAKSMLSERPSLAVLPFVNLGGDPDKEHLSDGITEQLINTLAKLEGLRVISRTSAFYFKRKDFDLRTIAEKLKVDMLLEGSVQIEGNRLRIMAQLIKVADDSHLWAKTYDREMSDFFAIQEEISRAIVDKLWPRLLDKRDRPLARNYTENVEAHALYLKGRCFEIKHSFEKAFEHFEQALALDPNYALAHAGLADVFNNMALFWSGSVKEFYPKAKAATMKALEIDDMLPEAYASLGYLKVHYEWDWKGAERALKRAIELNPADARSRSYYNTYLRAVGRLDEALAEIKIALELDPLSPHINARYGLTLLVDGQIDQTIEQLEKTLELYPNHVPSLLYLGDAYVIDGRYQDGLASLQKALSLTEGKTAAVLGILGYAYAEAGKREEARQILNEALERREREYFSPHFIGMLYTALGDKDKAFEWLGRAYEENDPGMYAIKGYPLLKRLHSDPRFTALLKRMGLEE